MTEITKYVCDMCGAVQALNTSPQRLLSNYFRIVRESMPINENTPDALCPQCAAQVFDYIKMERNKKADTNRQKD